MARQVSVGKRAIAIAVNENMAVSKLLKPGDRVDILAAIDYAAGQKDKYKIKTVLQDILVLQVRSCPYPILGIYPFLLPDP